jgi:hypothetical protein
MSKRKTWRASSAKDKKPQIPESIKLSLEAHADELIEKVLKLEHIKPPPADNDFNYLVDIYSKWYRNYFYFCSKYNSPSQNAISPSFEAKFARMEYMGDEKFNLSYMRHTKQWLEIYQDLSIFESIELISEEPHFIP